MKVALVFMGFRKIFQEGIDNGGLFYGVAKKDFCRGAQQGEISFLPTPKPREAFFYWNVNSKISN